MLNFHHTDNKTFFDYWQKLPREGLVPDKSDFIPEDIPKLLPNIIIYELISENIIHTRLSGTALDARDGFIKTGKNYLDFVAPDRKKKASEAFWLLSNHPCAMRVISKFRSANGLVKEVESIGAPLNDQKTGGKFLYYSSKEINLSTNVIQPLKDELEIITVTQRDFIDIGGGIPEYRD